MLDDEVFRKLVQTMVPGGLIHMIPRPIQHRHFPHRDPGSPGLH